MKDFKVYQASGMLNFLVSEASDVRKKEEKFSANFVSFTADAESPMKIVVDIESITGVSECTVNVSNANLLAIQPTGTGTFRGCYSNNGGFIFKKNVTYYLRQHNGELTAVAAYIMLYGTTTSLKTWYYNTTYTPTEDTVVWFRTYAPSEDAYSDDIFFEVFYETPTVDITVHQGTTISITFPDEVGTVTDGTLTIDYNGSVTLETGGQTYTLTSVSPINTLIGDNNIWSDAGDVSVTYLI